MTVNSLTTRTDTHIRKLDTILKTDVPAFNAKVKQAQTDAIAV